MPESSPDTNPGPLLQLHVLSAVAGWGRDLISIRAKDALPVRKSRGVKLGRPGVKGDLRNRAKDLFNHGIEANEVARITGVSLASVYRLRNITKDL